MKQLNQAEKFLDSLAHALSLERKERNLSLNRLSELSGINRQTIRFIELGTHRPTSATLYQISLGLDVPLWEIIKKSEQAAA